MEKAKIHILLVEDTAEDAGLVRAMLHTASAASPFELTHVLSLGGALAHLGRVVVDVILLDLSLPDAQGGDVLSRLGAAGSDVPIVVLATSDEEGLGARAHEWHAQDYLIKGQLTPDLLVRSMRHAIERHRLYRQLERARLQAEAASRAKGLFLGNMSHEIRTPMNLIVAMAEVLAGSPLTPEQQSYVRSFRASSAQLLRLTDDLLDLSSIESGHLDSEPAAFDLPFLLRQTVDLLSERARSKGVGLSCTIAPEVATVVIGDAEGLRQILVNLIGNAIKFTVKGEVCLRVIATEGLPGPTTDAFLHFSVSDTGDGIPSDKLRTIFESFTQLDDSITRRHEGSGIGLAISRRLVEAMGGQLAVESELGRGSTFMFALRMRVADAPRETARIPTATGRISVERAFELLIVDDAQDNRAVVEAYVKDTPYLLDFAKDGLEATRKFKSRSYDLVLMDVHMPVMDGHTATKAIRAWERAGGLLPTPIVALTADALRETKVAAMAAGCNECVTKPISRSHLLRVLAHHCMSSRGSRAIVTPPEEAPAAAAPARKRLRSAVEPGIAHLLPGYLRRRHEDIALLQRALETADYETVWTVGHKMKGSGRGYGLEGITDMGRALERAADQKNAPGVQICVTELAGYLEQVEAEAAP
jgi:signal transduction histidine kinase/BarA-like signal transduction histidine kinase/HPt (histidine-containing phosphotransfer) domain-containing protein